MAEDKKISQLSQIPILNPTDVFAIVDTSTGITRKVPVSMLDANGVEVMFVGKHGNDANNGKTFNKAKLTIQAAIDAIDDNASDNIYSILIYPGIYTEDIVMEDYVSLVGMGAFNDIEINGINSAPLITFDTDSSISKIENIALRITPTLDAQSLIVMTNGAHDLSRCNFIITSSTNHIGATVINQSGGTLNIYECQLTYTMSGTTAGTPKTHRIFNLSGTHTTEIHGISQSIITIADADDSFTFIQEIGTTIFLNVRRMDVEIDTTHASNVGTFIFLDTTAIGNEQVREIEMNHIDFQSSSTLANTAYFIRIDSISNDATIHLTSNTVHLDGFGIDFYTNIAAGDTVIDHFSDVTVSALLTGAGTLTKCFSSRDGWLHTENIEVEKEIHFSADFTELATGDTDQLIDVVAQVTGSTGGEAHIIDVALGGAGDAEITIIGAHPGVEVIHQHTGAFVTDAVQYYNGSIYSDISAGGAVMTNDNDVLYIGLDNKFDEIQFIFSTPSSHSIFQTTETWEYWNGSWISFSPADDTNGFRQNGSLRFGNGGLAGWATTTVNSITKYFVRVTRTRNYLGTSPILTSADMLISVLHKWDSEGRLGIKTFTQSAEPTTEDLPADMFCFWIDSDNSKLYICYNHGGTIKTTEMT